MDMDPIINPVDPAVKLESTYTNDTPDQDVKPQDLYTAEDSAVTKAETVERHGLPSNVDGEESPFKKRKIKDEAADSVVMNNHDSQDQSLSTAVAPLAPVERQKGVMPIKAEYLLHPPGSTDPRDDRAVHDDDAAEGAAHLPAKDSRDQYKKGKKEKPAKKTHRNVDSSRDAVGLCGSRTTNPEFSPEECRFGEKCKYEHDIRKYLKECKREDLTAFGGICPIWDSRGSCDRGWTCRFVGSHMEERATDDGRKELVLTSKERKEQNGTTAHPVSANDTVNEVSAQTKSDLWRRKIPIPKADKYSAWLDLHGKEVETHARQQTKLRRAEFDSDSEQELDSKPKLDSKPETSDTTVEEPAIENHDNDPQTSLHDNRAMYTEPPFLPSEKRRLYFGPETPVLAPLTTQGNLPFRRLCTSLGAQLTYSEMAMSLPLIQGQKSEWALLRAHSTETLPPAYNPSPSTPPTSYNNTTDLKFSAQIAAAKPWQALKATEILTTYCPSLRSIDLNSGCPIDLIYRQGAGSALLDHPSKLSKILRGMSTLSGSTPISVKIRTGTKSEKPTALKLLSRLLHGSPPTAEPPAGIAAITLHGRSRQQRYTKDADWAYIASCASFIASYNTRSATLADTVRAPDPRDLANAPASPTSTDASSPIVHFIGNGDCYAHTTYYSHLSHSGLSTTMLARGALIKPWLFSEITANQYLDPPPSERLSYIERFCRYGLECWGSDERGVSTTRRFLLEWLSFACRYVPLGVLEHLPPRLQDRAPAWRGRGDLEGLLKSQDVADWVAISEMFLGRAGEGFGFVPKHKGGGAAEGGEVAEG